MGASIVSLQPFYARSDSKGYLHKRHTPKKYFETSKGKWFCVRPDAELFPVCVVVTALIRTRLTQSKVLFGAPTNTPLAPIVGESCVKAKGEADSGVTYTSSICGYGGIGRHARFRIWWLSVQVQLLLSAPMWNSNVSTLWAPRNSRLKQLTGCRVTTTHLFWEQGQAGLIPVAPTINKRKD